MNSNSTLFHGKGIRKRLILAFIGIGILPFITAAIYFSWHNFVLQKKQIAAQQSTLTDLAAQSISSFFHEQKHLAASYIKLNFHMGVGQGNLDAKLREFLAASWDEDHNYILNSVYLIDGYGNELSHVSRASISMAENLRNLSGVDEFNVPFNKKIDYFGPVYFDPVLAEPLMKMALPIIDKKTDRSVGVLVAIMKFKPIWNMVAQLGIGNHRVAYVVDSNGVIVAHKNPSIVLSNLKLPAWEKRDVVINPGDRKVIRTTARIKYDGFPLYLVVESPVQKSYTHIYEEFAAVSIFIIVALFCAVIVGLFVLRKIIAPIEGISAMALNISLGDYSKRANYTNDDELGALASAFNQMTDNLVGSIKREEQEKKFVQSAIESLTHPFIVFDAKDHHVILENHAAKKHGAEGCTSCYASTHGYSAPCVDAGVRRSFDKVIATKAPVTIEQVCNMKSGVVRYCEVNAYPIFDSQNNVIQIIEYIVDVTEKKMLESQLRQAKKLEALGSLAGGVAHDFNNLLTGIVGYAELTLKNLPQGSPLRNGIEVILESGNKGADLTSQLLTFSRKGDLKPQVVRPVEIVDSCCKIIKGLIGDKVKLELNLESDLWNIYADVGQLNQLLVNLSINARDAMPDGGTLAIDVSNIDLTDEDAHFYDGLNAGDYIKIVVTDTGVGMSDDVLEHIFEPFFTTKKQYGTGLGMAIVYGVVKQHGGSINVKSALGKGTQIIILLPATDAVVENKDNDESLSLLEGNEVVLVVDDDPGVVNLIKDILFVHGYTVHTASSGDEALSVCAALDGHIDLLLTDVVMPEMTGRELANIVNQKYSSVKTIFISGHHDDVLVNCNVFREQVALINKPIRVGSILALIRSVLDNERAASVPADTPYEGE